MQAEYSKYINYTSRKLNEELIGKVFGKLTVIEQVESYRNISTKGTHTTRSRFKCICSCGEIRIAEGTKLRNGKVSRCMTCAYKSRPQSIERLTDEQRLFNLCVVNRCKGKNIKLEIDVNQYITISSNPCFYCGEPPKERTFLNTAKRVKHIPLFLHGIDRLDSNKGYIIDNCVSCCKYCNVAKSTMSVEQFKNHINKIFKYWIKGEDIIKEN